MKRRIEADYERQQNRSIKTVEYCFKHLEAAFQFHRVIDITTPVVKSTPGPTEGRSRPGIG